MGVMLFLVDALRNGFCVVTVCSEFAIFVFFP